MKKYSLTLIGILLMVIFFSCKKDSDLPSFPHHPPADTSTARIFRLSFDGIPAPPDVLANLTAIISIVANNDATVVADKVVSVAYNERYLSDTIRLKKGNYKIATVLIKQGDSTVLFAAPRRGSVKASLVTKPLSVSIALDEKKEKIFPIDLLPVSGADHPQEFGYPEGSFGNRPNEPETPVSKRIFIRPLIRIGNIVYDSIPVQVILRSWDAKDNMISSFISLPAGLQPIQLPADGVKYQLSISKWGTYDELILMKEQVQENTIYVMGGSTAAKKLKTVYDYKLVNGISTPQTKTDYEYLPGGELKQRLVWAKRTDGSNYVQRKDLFDYQLANITGVRSYDENNTLIKTSQFNYNNEGRITAIDEVEGTSRTSGAVYYTPLGTSSGITGDYRIDINYTHDPSYFSSSYSKIMHGGTVLSDVFSTSHGNLEEGMYDYDYNINPYVHLRIPDLMLSYVSKHNKLHEYKTRVNTFPEFEPISFNYNYSNDGYPTEQFVKYRSYHTKQEAFTIRTVFVY